MSELTAFEQWERAGKLHLEAIDTYAKAANTWAEAEIKRANALHTQEKIRVVMTVRNELQLIFRESHRLAYKIKQKLEMIEERRRKILPLKAGSPGMGATQLSLAFAAWDWFLLDTVPAGYSDLLLTPATEEMLQSKGAYHTLVHEKEKPVVFPSDLKTLGQILIHCRSHFLAPLSGYALHREITRLLAMLEEVPLHRIVQLQAAKEKMQTNYRENMHSLAELLGISLQATPAS